MRCFAATVRYMLAIWLVLSPGAGSSAAGELLTAERLADVRELVRHVVSADGANVAYELRTMRDSGEPASDVWLVPTDGSAAPRPLAMSGSDDTEPQWAPDSRSIAFLSTRDEDGRQIYLQSLDGSVPGKLTSVRNGVDRFAWSPEGDRIAFIAPVPAGDGDRSTGKGLWLLDLAGPSSHPLTSRDNTVMDVTWSPDGRELAVIMDNELAVIDPELGVVVRVLHENASKPWSRRQIFDWAPDGSKILFAELEAAEKSPAGIGFWMAVVPAKGGAARPLLKHHPGTVTQAVWAADSRHVVAQSFEGTASRILRIDGETEEFSVLVDEILAEKYFDISRDDEWLVYASATLKEPPELWSHHAASGRRRLTRLNPELAGLKLGAVSEITWTNADGDTIHGVLVLPPGHEPGRPVPMILQLHGGPHYAWWRGWFGDWHDWAQLLAQRGYAVFLPNPRGSTGKGLKFSLANVNDIAHGPLADVLAGVDMLITEGIANPERLGVGGWSYGGYLTAWAITQTSIFKAAVVGAGISRVTSRSPMLLKEYYENIPVRERYLQLTQVSPEYFLHQVVTPTLVIHGADDAKIDRRQGIELHDGLQELGVDTELVVYPGEGHGIHRREHRIDMLQRIVDWYDKHMN